MPAFSFEKISPPVRRGPIAEADEKKPRGLIVRLLDRFSEARTERSLRKRRSDTSQRNSSG
jgi:hypothetical protein